MIDYLVTIYDAAFIFYPSVFITCLVWAYFRPPDKNIVFHLHTCNQLTLALAAAGEILFTGIRFYQFSTLLHGSALEETVYVNVLPDTYFLIGLTLFCCLYFQLFWFNYFREHLIFSWIALVLCFLFISVQFLYDFGHINIDIGGKDYIAYSSDIHSYRFFENFWLGMLLYGVEFVLLYIIVGRKKI